MPCSTEGHGQLQDGHRWSHIHMWWIKIRMDTLGANDPNPRTDCTSQGSSARKINPHNFQLKKTVGTGGSRRNCWIFRKLHLKGLHTLKMYANPPTLGFNTRATVGRAPVAYGEWVK